MVRVFSSVVFHLIKYDFQANKIHFSFLFLISELITELRSLQAFSQVYNLGSLITYGVCAYFVHETRALQFKSVSERQIS